MCQHVRGRRAGSSERGGRETGIPLRVPRCGPPELRDVVIVIVDVDDGPSASSTVISPRRSVRDGHDDDGRQHHDDDDDRVGEDQQRRRGRGCCGGSCLTSQTETVTEDAREIGEPRRCSGRLHDCWMADARLLSGPVDDVGKRVGRGPTIRAEEAGSPKSLQSGSGGRRDARPVGRNGTPSRRLENGFYPTARSQGGRQAAHCWQDAFLPRSLSSGIQVLDLASTDNDKFSTILESNEIKD